MAHNCGGEACVHDHGREGSEDEGKWISALVDTPRVRCLNGEWAARWMGGGPAFRGRAGTSSRTDARRAERVEGSGKHVFKPHARRADCVPFVESCEGEDPELLFHVPFTQAVRLRSLCVVAGGGEELAPLKARLFTERDDLDFGAVESLKPVQTFELVPDFRGLVDCAVVSPLRVSLELTAAPSPGARAADPLVASKFSGVSSVTLHLRGSVGGDAVRVNCVGFKGEGTGFRHGVVETTYEAAAQIKDHPKTRATGGGGAVV